MTFLCTCTHVRFYTLATHHMGWGGVGWGGDADVLLHLHTCENLLTLYYKVLLCTKYYSVLQSTTPVLLCTTPVLLCTTKYYSVLLQCYSVLQSTTLYHSSTTLYYKVLLQYYSVLQSNVKPCRSISVNSLRPERSQIYAPSDPKFTPEAIQNLRPKRPRAHFQMISGSPILSRIHKTGLPLCAPLNNITRPSV